MQKHSGVYCGEKGPDGAGAVAMSQRTESGLKRRGELRLIEQAIRNGWPVPADQKRQSVRLMLDTLEDKNASDREQRTALRVLRMLVLHADTLEDKADG